MVKKLQKNRRPDTQLVTSVQTLTVTSHGLMKMNKDEILNRISDEVKESIVKNSDQLEAQCRSRNCRVWRQSEGSRNRHEQKKHSEDELVMPEKFRDPNNGEIFSKKELVILES